MRRVRAYSREERKRLIIHHFAESVRVGENPVMTCAEIARKMDIRPSTKLRDILLEMVLDNTLLMSQQEDAGIAGFRVLYELNPFNDAFSEQHASPRATRMHHAIRLNTSNGVEELWLS